MLKSILLFGLLFSLAPMFAFGQDAQEKTKAQIDSVSYSVKGMSCSACAGFVNGAAKSIEGVKQCIVSLKNGRADIKYDPTKTNKHEIEKALKSTGYAIAEITNTKKKNNKEQDNGSE